MRGERVVSITTMQNENGKTLGSIGGGCGEGKVIRTAQEVIRTGEEQTLRINMTGDVAEEEGMVCGGIMDVIIEPFGKNNS